MKIACISDTHNIANEWISIDPNCDVVLHAGDATMRGTKDEIAHFIEWYKNLPGIKVFVPGNHDFFCENNQKEAREMFESAGIVFLMDEKVVINDVVFYGTPQQPWFHSWAFNVISAEKRKEIYSRIPDETSVLITHCPPSYIRDRTAHQENAGCPELHEKVKNMPNLKLHVFGHIHEGYGTQQIGNCHFVNASQCGFPRYERLNQPIYISI